MRDFFLDEKSVFPFVIIIVMTVLLFYNNSMIVSAQKTAYESDKIVNELRDSSEDLTKYVRTFVATGNPKHEAEYWKVLNIRNGKAARPDGRKIPLSVLMKQLGFTNNELDKLKESQANSDKLVKKEVIAMNAIKGVYDVNVSKLIKPNESKRDFAIRIINDESYDHDKASIMSPINDVIQLVNKRTQIELMNYNILNFIYMFISFFIVLLLFIRFIFLIHRVKQHIESEKVIRKIIEIMRSSIDIKSVRSQVVKEIGFFFKADRVFFADYDSVNNSFSVSEDSEYKSSEKVKSYAGNEKAITQGLVDAIKTFPLTGQDLIFSDLDKYLEENNLKELGTEQTLRSMGCIAMIGVHISYGESFYGDIVVTFEKKRKIRESDINFVKTLADQAGIAIYQAELYKKIQFQAERERINRTIIEILRSSMDKAIIKKLFVRNIGKLFDADRVFFSDYDPTTNTYLPVEENSEYLSNDNQKSFIGFDWSSPDINEHIKILLERREIKIANFDEYINEHPNMNKKLISRYVDYGVKSSYNFPVLDQNNIMGYFCIEFTNKVCELTEEDINRTRRICVQAGIALYQAELYLQAQQCALSKESSISELSEQIKKPANEILDLSLQLSKNEYERKAQIEYLNTIICSCNHLLELTKNISEDLN